MMTRQSFLPLGAAVLLVMCGAQGLSQGITQNYPTKPVRVVEPFGAGGGPDLVARALSMRLSALWGHSVTVENHPGAGSTAAPALVAKSPADGHTLLVNTSAHVYSAAFVKPLPYDPLQDFIPVAPLTSQPYVLVAAPAARITTIADSCGQTSSAGGDRLPENQRNGLTVVLRVPLVLR